MVFLSFWIFGVLLIIFQTTLLQFLPSWIGRPDFLFIFIAFLAYRFAWIPGIILTFSLSWIMDVVAGIHLGFYPLVCLLTFVGLKTLATKSPVKESTYQIPLVGLSFFLMQMFLYFVYSLSWPEVLPEWSWGQTLQRTGLIMVVAIPIFILSNAFMDYLRKRQMRSKPPRRRSRKSASRI